MKRFQSFNTKAECQSFIDSLDIKGNFDVWAVPIKKDSKWIALLPEGHDGEVLTPGFFDSDKEPGE